MARNHPGLILIDKGPGTGKEIPLVAGKTIKIGRSAECDICIPDKTVSRIHAELVVKEDTIIFTNSGVNGSMINGVQIKNNRPVILQYGSNIVIGPCSLRITPVIRKNTEEISIKDISRTIQISGSVPEKIIKDNKGKKVINVSLLKRITNRLPESRKSIAIVGVIVCFGILYLLLPQHNRSNGHTNKSENTVNKDSLVLSINIPQVIIDGSPSEGELHTALFNFQAAEKLFAEQKLSDCNIYESIKKWQHGIDLIGKYSQRPAAYDSAIVNLRNAKKTLHEKFRKLERVIRTTAKQKDYKSTCIAAQVILNSIPDNMDWRYRWAKEVESKYKLLSQKSD